MLFTDAHAADAPATTSATLDTSTPPPVSPDRMMMETVAMLGLMFAIFYFILIRPQQKRLREHQAMLKSIHKGTKVITGGGIIGTVVKQESDNILLVEIAKDVRVHVARSSISEVMTDKTSTANDN